MQEALAHHATPLKPTGPALEARGMANEEERCWGGGGGERQQLCCGHCMMRVTQCEQKQFEEGGAREAEVVVNSMIVMLTK